MGSKRVVQCLLVGEVQFDKVDALIGEKLAAGGGTHCRPGLIATAQRLGHQKATNEASRASY